MAWAQEMKNLAADIRTSHRDRSTRLSEIKNETKEIRKQGQQILRDADTFIKNVHAELTQAAKDLKDFLADSEGTRKKDFEALLKRIQARIEEIKDGMKDFIAQSEEKRIVDFKTMMKDIKGDIESIKKSVAATMQSTGDLISGYTGERREAARYWGGARGREGAEEVEEVASKKRGRRKKK